MVLSDTLDIVWTPTKGLSIEAGWHNILIQMDSVIYSCHDSIFKTLCHQACMAKPLP